jgi:predicted dehydrogenase
MGRLHSEAYARVPHHYPDCRGVARLVVAADEVEERARQATSHLGFERATTAWREVIADPEVDAVSITAPNFLHREMALAACEAGKHFWGEKPLGRSPAETAEIAAAVELAGVRTIVGLNYRHAPAVQRARRLVADGALGEIAHVRLQFVAGYSSSPRGALSWRFLQELAGLGVLADLGSHAIDLAQFLLGPVAKVAAATSIVIPKRPRVAAGHGTHFSVVEDSAELGAVENEDWAAALLEFENGVMGTLELSRVAVGAEARYAFEISGADGAVAWDFERLNELRVYAPLSTGDRGDARVLMGPGHPDFERFQPGAGIPMGYDDLKVIEAALFLESAADGVQRAPGAREMDAAARVIDAMVRSAKSATWATVRRG